jgi:hypothetical protein
MITYTTENELAFMHDLARREKWQALLGLRKALDLRSWEDTGNVRGASGMNVDPVRVRYTLERLLGFTDEHSA